MAWYISRIFVTQCLKPPPLVRTVDGHRRDKSISSGRSDTRRAREQEANLGGLYVELKPKNIEF